MRLVYSIDYFLATDISIQKPVTQSVMYLLNFFCRRQVSSSYDGGEAVNGGVAQECTHKVRRSSHQLLYFHVLVTFVVVIEFAVPVYSS